MMAYCIINETNITHFDPCSTQFYAFKRSYEQHKCSVVLPTVQSVSVCGYLEFSSNHIFTKKLSRCTNSCWFMCGAILSLINVFLSAKIIDLDWNHCLFHFLTLKKTWFRRHKRLWNIHLVSTSVWGSVSITLLIVMWLCFTDFDALPWDTILTTAFAFLS